MASRLPSARPLANSASTVALLWNRRGETRLIELRPWALVLGGTALTALLAWYLVATLYFVFRDEMLAKLMGQQTEMQYAYEDRIATLRNQIDRLASRQLVDQDTVEGKVHELMARQAKLETRQAVVASLFDQPAFAGLRQQAVRAPTITGSTGAATPALPPGATAFAPAMPRPLPMPEPFETRAPAIQPSGQVGGPEQTMPPLERRSALEEATGGALLTLRIAGIRESADRLEKNQGLAVEVMERALRQQQTRLASALSDTGLDIGRFPLPRAQGAAQGGPLVPLQASTRDSFEQRVTRLQAHLQQTERVRRVVGTLPTNRPMASAVEISSGFGARSDPFTRSLAMHTGIDFRAPSGTQVRVAAAGKVVEAGWMGGYGQMVEVDHGHGLTTRYAHLSSIEVEVGDTVQRGEIVGKVGSTGRSTGPHLHYEVRVDGEAVDPMRFIRAGQKLTEAR
jgi:murein DD-endopeptidase MepM/ murein hydrolase activator NlpD